MDSTECAEYSRGVSSTILHIFTCPRKQYVGPLNKLEMDIFKKCPFPIYSAGPTYCFVDSNILCKIRHFMCFNVHGAAG